MHSSISPAGHGPATSQAIWREAAIWSVVAASLFWCYRSVFAILVSQWISNDTYSHGFLIPGVAAYVVWARRDRLRAAGPWRPSLVGLVIFVLGVAMLLGGRLVSVVAIQELSLLLVLAALVLLLMGWRPLGVVWLPIAYLLFMIPVWDVVTERLHYPFQLFSATVGAWLMGVFGVPVFRSANYLQLPNITLEVAKVCSGFSYLLSVVAVGVPLAYLSLHDNRKRALLVVFGVVVAVLANPVRVALIGLLAYRGTGGYLHGPWHVLQGLFVAGVGYLALFVGASWLGGDRRTPAAVPPLRLAPENADRAVTRTRPGRRSLLLAAGASACLFLAGSVRPEAWALPTSAFEMLPDIPFDLGGWKGRHSSPSANTGDLDLASQCELYRSYQRATGQEVEICVGTFGHQLTPNGEVTYWTDKIQSDAIRATLATGSAGSLNVNRVELRGPEHVESIVYWYVLDGREVRDRVTAKLFGLWVRLSGGRRPLVVALICARPIAGGEATGSDPFAEFVREALPTLRQALTPPARGLVTPPGQ